VSRTTLEAEGMLAQKGRSQETKEARRDRERRWAAEGEVGATRWFALAEAGSLQGSELTMWV